MEFLCQSRSVPCRADGGLDVCPHTRQQAGVQHQCPGKSQDSRDSRHVLLAYVRAHWVVVWTRAGIQAPDGCSLVLTLHVQGFPRRDAGLDKNYGKLSTRCFFPGEWLGSNVNSVLSTLSPTLLPSRNLNSQNFLRS